MQSFDTSKKGSSALVAALSRNLAAEIAFFRGKQSIAAFNDFFKFFDTIFLPALIEKLKELSYPCIAACLALQQHVAPRLLKCQGFIGE